MTTTLRPLDLNLVLYRLPDDVLSLLKKYNLFLAGGFIRANLSRERASDIDIFGDEEVLKTAANELAELREVKTFKTGNAITVVAPGRLPVQFITGFPFESAEVILNGFDFTIACAVVWWEPGISPNDQLTQGRWTSLISEDFYPDMANKLLKYTKNGIACSSLLRARKFISRGYHLDIDSLAYLVARTIQVVDWSEYTQPMDVDRVAFILRGQLREIDPLVVIPGVNDLEEK